MEPEPGAYTVQHNSLLLLQVKQLNALADIFTYFFAKKLNQFG